MQMQMIIQYRRLARYRYRYRYRYTHTDTHTHTHTDTHTHTHTHTLTDSHTPNNFITLLIMMMTTMMMIQDILFADWREIDCISILGGCHARAYW